MRVLIACESSGRVRQAFRELGHDAYSNDLLPADDSSPFHILGDCVSTISLGWDLIIMHPPCTALCVSGNRWYGRGAPKHDARLRSITWTMRLWELALSNASAVAMENPVGVLPLPPTQYIQPWQFGHGETKKTGLWLHNLPLLRPTDVVGGRKQAVWRMAPSADRWKKRSVTYQGIAAAMAAQWSAPAPVMLQLQFPFLSAPESPAESGASSVC